MTLAYGWGPFEAEKLPVTRLLWWAREAVRLKAAKPGES